MSWCVDDDPKQVAFAMVDVTIRGAGIFGLSIAWACQRRGATVRVVDPYGVGAGSSGGIVGALAPHTPERWNAKKQFQFESLDMAEGWWAEVAQASGRDPGYGRTGRVQPIADARALDLAHTRAEAARDLWQGRYGWSVERASGDWTPISPTGWVIRDTLSARMHPRQACAALAACLDVVSEAPDQGAVVWATGWQGIQDLSTQFGRTMGGGVKGQAVSLDFDARDLPQIYADSLHVIPHRDGTVAIGSTSEREFDDPTRTDAQLDDVLTRAVAAVPALANAPIRARWAGVRPRAKSRAPMLGAWPDRPGHFIANGGFKIGFGMAPKIAEVMADLILGKDDTIPDGFRVEDNL